MTSPAARRGQTQKSYTNLMGYLFVAPAVLFFLAFTAIPVVIAISISLTNYDVFSQLKFVGLDNYLRAFDDPIFRKALLNILYFSLMYIPLVMVGSFLIAALVNRPTASAKAFRTVYYAPGLTSAVASATVWLWLLNPTYGLVNTLLAAFGIQGPMWLNHSDTAMISVVIICAWGALGGNMIIYLAAMQNIPPSLYEYARLEGARWHTVAGRITLPLVAPTSFFVLTMTLIGAFQLFDQAYVLTKGGPANATMTPVYLIYGNAFTELQMGYASAQSVLLFAIILTISLVTQKVNKNSYF